MQRLRDDSGVALVTALFSTIVMLALGLALLSIVDTQTSESASERTRDRGFNLSESVLNSQAFVLGRNWPDAGPAGNPACSRGGGLRRHGRHDRADRGGRCLRRRERRPTAQRFPLARRRGSDPTSTPATPTARTANATWQVNVCDDVDPDGAGPTEGVTTWDRPRCCRSRTGTPTTNNRVWVRAQSTVGTKTRVLVGLVQVKNVGCGEPEVRARRRQHQQRSRTGAAAITDRAVEERLVDWLLNPGSPPVGADPAYPAPASGVTGVRCGLLENVTQVKTCITGAIGALSAVPLVNTLSEQDKIEQYPYSPSTTPDTIGQLRTQSKCAPGVYMATAPGRAGRGGSGLRHSGATANAVVFIEKVGTGDQYCVIDVSNTERQVQGTRHRQRPRHHPRQGVDHDYNSAAETEPVHRRHLRAQPADGRPDVGSPLKPLIRVDGGARVRGAVHADGKNATIALVAPDFNTAALVSGLLCPGALCALAPTLNGLLGTLGVSGTVNALINGTCLVTLPLLGCTVSCSG